jgi:hypothetical protein
VSNWALIGLSLAGMIFTLVGNALIVAWLVGRRTQKYDAFGEKVQYIPGLKEDVKAIKQALLDHGIPITNGGH